MIVQIRFCLQLEKEVFKKRFWQNHKGNYGASFSALKKTPINGSFFFKIHIVYLYKSTFGQA